MKVVSKKEVLGILGLCLISSLLTAAYVYGQVVSQTFIVSGGSYPGAPNYTIWTDGATYYAKNAYGALSFSSVIFPTVFQSCQDALNLNGGLIEISEGNYYVGAVLNITLDRIHVRGAGRSTVLTSTADTDYIFTIANGLDRPVIEDLCFYNPNAGVYTIAAVLAQIDTETIYHLEVKDCVFLTIDGIYTNQHVDHDRNLFHPKFLDLSFDEPPAFCFKLYDCIDAEIERIICLRSSYAAGTYGIWYDPAGVSAGMRINNFRSFRQEYGIYVDSAVDVSVTNAICDLGKYGFFINDCDRCMFTNCYAGATVAPGVGYTINGDSHQNRFVNSEARSCASGFVNNAPANNSQAFIGCDTAGCTSTYTLQTGDVLYGDTTFITETSGAAEIVSGQTSVVVAHGCSYTPIAQDISITFSENPTNTPGLCFITDINATHFRTNVENDPGASNLSFSWSVCFGRRIG